MIKELWGSFLRGQNTLLLEQAGWAAACKFSPTFLLLGERLPVWPLALSPSPTCCPHPNLFLSGMLVLPSKRLCRRQSHWALSFSHWVWAPCLELKGNLRSSACMVAPLSHVRVMVAASSLLPCFWQDWQGLLPPAGPIPAGDWEMDAEHNWHQLEPPKRQVKKHPEPGWCQPRWVMPALLAASSRGNLAYSQPVSRASQLLAIV